MAGEIAPFKPGDIVVVRSGGPKMTVSQCAEDGLGKMKVWCEWFEGTKQMSGTFSPAVLKLSDN